MENKERPLSKNSTQQLDKMLKDPTTSAIMRASIRQILKNRINNNIKTLKKNSTPIIDKIEIKGFKDVDEVIESNKKKAKKPAPVILKKKAHGVIESIIEIVKTSEKPINIEEITLKLEEFFPNRSIDKMRKTVKVQISGSQPTRLEKEKSVKFIITKEFDKELKRDVKYFSIVE